MSILNLIAAVPANSSAILSAGHLPLTFGALSVQAEKVMRFLNLHRIGRADCVAVVLPNGPELAAAFTGVSAAAVCAPLNPAYSASEFHFYLSDLRACALLTEAGFCPAATRAAIDLDIPILSLRCPDQALAGVFELEGSAPSGPAAHPGIAGKDGTNELTVPGCSTPDWRLITVVLPVSSKVTGSSDPKAAVACPGKPLNWIQLVVVVSQNVG